MPTAPASPARGAHSVVAGVVAGCVTRSCTSPLDVLKIVIQVNGPAPRLSLLSSSAALASTSAPSALVRTVRELYSLEGVRAFWRGNAAGCCRLGPYAGAKFFIFDALQERMAASGELSNGQRALCGAAAGLVATMGTYPLEVVRTRMITQSARHIRGVAHGLRSITRAEGLRGLYRGGCSGIVGAIPFEGAQFGCYEYLKLTARDQQWPRWRWPAGKTELDALDFLVCGSLAGAVGQTVAYPFDTVKKRLQAQALGSGEHYYSGSLDCARRVVRDEGVLALYRGTLPNLARIAPYAAVMFSTFETTKRALQALT